MTAAHALRPQHAAGIRSDPEMDARFDALLAGEEAAHRLEALRRK